MWLIIKEWFNRNKAYLSMILLASLAVGAGIACLCTIFPTLLAGISSLTLFGVAPLAFLNALSFPLAVFTLSTIMTGISSIIIAADIWIVKQAVTIGFQIYSLFQSDNEVQEVPVSENSYDFLNKYLRLESSELFFDVDDEEFHELSSDSTSEEESPPTVSPKDNFMRSEETPTSTKFRI